MTAKRTDRHQLQELVRPHRLGTGAREALPQLATVHAGTFARALARALRATARTYTSRMAIHPKVATMLLVVTGSVPSCSATSGGVPGTPLAVDSGVPNASEVDSGIPGRGRSQTAGVGLAGCEKAPNEPDVEMIPEFWTAFERIGGGCGGLGSGILVRNGGASPLRIIGLSVSPTEFSIESDDLPVELAPGTSLVVRVFYDDDAPGDMTGSLGVATTAGCRSFPVKGLSTTGTLISRSREAIDFGHVPIGAASESRDMTLVTDRASDDPAMITLTAFGTDAELFELVSAPSGAVQPGGCAPITLSLRVREQSTLGPIQGNVFWRTLVERESGSFEAVAFVPIYANIVESSR
jgi:hypothetical protein